jgi:hypothetical protein
MSQTGTFHDQLVPVEVVDLPERFFDRFVFNLHPRHASTPSVIFGFGTYPAKDTVDGFVVLTNDTEQRNLRYSTERSATDGSGGGPFTFEVTEPNQTWRLRLAPNPIGVEFDLNWHARTPAWFGEIAVQNTHAETSSFDHLFQSGCYQGTLTIDGRSQSVDGWYGQRDRSRGVRTMSGGQGLHIWYQAQFPDRSIGFLLVETRGHQRLLLKGAVMHVDGELDPITDVRHDLAFDESLDLRSGTVEVSTLGGRRYTVDADATAGGGYMAGAGYGGHHGVPAGRDHIESDSYPLDGSVTPRTLNSALTDRLAEFHWGSQTGRGIFEFALTRSSSYRYQPTLDSQ